MNRILVIQTASIGDVILATSLIEGLHAKFPGATIDFLIKKGIEPLLSGHPFLHRVMVWDKRDGKYRHFFRLVGEVRRNRYDLVINVQRFFLTGLLTALSGAGETRGFIKNPLSPFFSHRYHHSTGEGMHETERNQALVSGLIHGHPFKPRLYPEAADREKAEALVSRTSYTLSPASLWFTKQYPVRKWADLVALIPREADVFLLGSEADASLCEEIVQLTHHPGLKNMAGKLTLLQSAALMKLARMNFTNDSAPMHLASAVDAPVTAIYCSTIPGFGFGPLSTDSRIAEYSGVLSCRPCGLHGYRACPEKHFKCGYGIDTKLLTGRL